MGVGVQGFRVVLGALLDAPHGRSGNVLRCYVGESC